MRLNHHHQQCVECGEFWTLAYDDASALYNWLRVEYEIALIELEYANHQADHAIQELTYESITDNQRSSYDRA